MQLYPLEEPRQGASNEYPQHMFLLRNKKDISIFPMKKVPYLLLVYTTSFHYGTLPGSEQVIVTSISWNDAQHHSSSVSKHMVSFFSR